MKRVLMVAIAVLLQSCATAPRTSEEFKQGVLQGKGMTKHETFYVTRKFSDVYKSIKTKSNECFNIVTKRRSNQISVVNALTSKIDVIGKNRAELVIKQDNGYRLVAEIFGESKRKTKVTIYGMSFSWDSVFSSIKAWANGVKKKCP